MKAHCTTLDSRSFGVAAGTMAAGLSGLCAFFLAVAPDGTRRMLGVLVHADLSSLGMNLSWSGALIGIACWGVGVGLVFATAARLYNRLAGAARADRRTAGALEAM